jgi:hypothetical protein
MEGTEDAERVLAAKLVVILPHLDERQRRLLLGPRPGRWAMAGSAWWPGLPGSARTPCRSASVTWRPTRSRWAGCLHRPRIKAGEGTGRRPVLTLADRLLAAVLHYRLALPQVAIAALLGVRPETVNKRLRDIRELLDQAGITIQPGPCRLANLEELHDLARLAGIEYSRQDQVSVLFSGKPLIGLTACQMLRWMPMWLQVARDSGR